MPAAAQFDPPPQETEPRPRRSAGTWIVLMIVWAVGLFSCITWIVVIGYVLIRVLIV